MDTPDPTRSAPPAAPAAPAPAPAADTTPAPDVVLGPAQLEAQLQALPNWEHRDGQLRRHVRTGGWKATLMVVNTVGHLAEAAWHHPDLSVSYAEVHIKLVTHSAGGITAKDIALARKIEEVLMWRPAAEPGNPLEGTPDDPRLRYLKYD